MKNHILTTVSAVALAVALSATAVSAQDLAQTQLQDSATTTFAQLGLDTAVIDVLTVDELAQIETVASGSSSNEEKSEQIMLIVADAEARMPTEPAAPSEDLGLTQLRDSATTTLSQLGMDTSALDAMSLDELAQVQAVGSGSATDNEKVGQIERIIAAADARVMSGDAASATGATGDVTSADLSSTAALEASVGQDLAQLGYSSDIASRLTADQLIQIQLIRSNQDGEAAQREKIEQIIGSN
jgi:hypothetical protein